jgi:transposase
MVRALHVVRRSAVKARTQAANQLRALLVTAPEELKAELRELSTDKLVATAARFRPSGLAKDLRAATKLAMRSVARRHLRLSEEIAELEEQITQLVSEAVPALVSLRGVGTDTAASLLVAVGDNPGRLKSEASFARLCGVAPVPASSGKTVRYRLNRGGNRDANRALHVLALGRMSWDERTPASTWRDVSQRARARGRSCGA